MMEMTRREMLTGAEALTLAPSAAVAAPTGAISYAAWDPGDFLVGVDVGTGDDSTVMVLFRRDRDGVVVLDSVETPEQSSDREGSDGS